MRRTHTHTQRTRDIRNRPTLILQPFSVCMSAHTFDSYAEDLLTSSPNCSGRLRYLFCAFFATHPEKFFDATFPSSFRDRFSCDTALAMLRRRYGHCVVHMLLSSLSAVIMFDTTIKSEHIFHVIVVLTCLPSIQCLAPAATLLVDA